MMGIRQRRFGGNEGVRDHFANVKGGIEPDKSSEKGLVLTVVRS
jgi:hypothetical protein